MRNRCPAVEPKDMLKNRTEFLCGRRWQPDGPAISPVHPQLDLLQKELYSYGRTFDHRLST